MIRKGVAVSEISKTFGMSPNYIGQIALQLGIAARHVTRKNDLSYRVIAELLKGELSPHEMSDTLHISISYYYRVRSICLDHKIPIHERYRERTCPTTPNLTS